MGTQQGNGLEGKTLLLNHLFYIGRNGESVCRSSGTPAKNQILCLR